MNFKNFISLTSNKIFIGRPIMVNFYCTTNQTHKKLNMNLGFIGFGKIAQAMSLGIIDKNLLNANQIFASDHNNDHLNKLKTSIHSAFKDSAINFCKTNEDLVQNVQTIVISVKPSDIQELLKNISKYVTEKHLIISVAAGIKLENLENQLPKNSKIIRIMTNIPALIQEGCSVYAKGTNCTPDDEELVKTLLNAIGTCEGELNERLFDVVTALSGSGPAYMCIMLDALADGALKEGLKKELALKLAARTMYGTAAMILREKSKHICQFRDDVCSPAGTTIHGIKELDDNKFRYALMKCVEAGTKRSRELSEQ